MLCFYVALRSLFHDKLDTITLRLLAVHPVQNTFYNSQLCTCVCCGCRQRCVGWYCLSAGLETGQRTSCSVYCCYSTVILVAICLSFSVNISFTYCNYTPGTVYSCTAWLNFSSSISHSVPEFWGLPSHVSSSLEQGTCGRLVAKNDEVCEVAWWLTVC